jgi:hypothetical protein
VLLYGKRHGRLPTRAFWAAVTLGEGLRAAAGRRTSQAALSALLRPGERVTELDPAPPPEPLPLPEPAPRPEAEATPVGDPVGEPQGEPQGEPEGEPQGAPAASGGRGEP